jgi:hypothetical protein
MIKRAMIGSIYIVMSMAVVVTSIRFVSFVQSW